MKRETRDVIELHYRTRYNQPDPELTKSREYSGSINYFSKEFRELPGLDTTIIVPKSIKNTPHCFALFSGMMELLEILTGGRSAQTQAGLNTHSAEIQRLMTPFFLELALAADWDVLTSTYHGMETRAWWKVYDSLFEPS